MFNNEGSVLFHGSLCSEIAFSTQQSWISNQMIKNPVDVQELLVETLPIATEENITLEWETCLAEKVRPFIFLVGKSLRTTQREREK